VRIRINFECPSNIALHRAMRSPMFPEVLKVEKS